MPPPPLGKIRTFQHLLAYTIDELDWPVDDSLTLDESTFSYTADELEIPPEQFVGVELRTLRSPAGAELPFGIILVKFEARKLTVTALRQALRAFAKPKRPKPENAHRPLWALEHLLFICSHTTDEGAAITFVHFDRLSGTGTAKLSSFGWTEQSHNRTAYEFNLKRLKWPANPADTAAWRELWQSAFDVSKVTEEFFKQYGVVFAEVEAKASDVPEKHRREYTQRLFNRLLFLYFIQKKGWLEFEGDRNYLRALWNAAERSKGQKYEEVKLDDYLNGRLHWAFFHGLNTPGENAEHHKNDVLKMLRGTVPFLNGGLFDIEPDGYDNFDTVKIPNATFDSVLKLFERYNFTVMESTPLDIEVAVDPEMLGKVFEELVTGRHESGSYYTPRTIVAFMCREALKGYLATSLTPLSPGGRGVGGEGAVLRPSPLEGEGGAQHRERGSSTNPDTTPLPAAKRGDPLPQGERVKEAIAKFVDHGDASGLTDPDAVLTALKNVTVCDPACGSGAYLLGMMQELLRLRDALFAAHAKDHAAIYERKLEIIQRNLYGVDKDPFAVGIAKLRLWLSLAVDFHGGKPPTLPNLDYRIECGDSLLGPNPAFTNDLGGLALKDTLKELKADKAQFGREHGETKRALKKRIDELQHDLQMLLDSPDGLFDWRVAFVEVFETGGFDVVLANPPYISALEFTRIYPAEYRVALTSSYEVAKGAWDVYVLFFERAVQILKKNGMLTFITPNKYLSIKYAVKLRGNRSRAIQKWPFVRHGL